MIVKAAQTLLAGVLLMAPSLPAPLPAGDRAHQIEGARLIGARRLGDNLFHVQGLALDRAHVWATSVDRAGQRGYLHLFDRASGRLLRRIDLTDGQRYHVGGISLSGTSLWVPVAEMRPDSSAVLLELDAATLQVRRRIPVADHIGCIAASGGRLVAGNWDSRLLYVIDPHGAAAIRALPNPSATHFQDMKFVGSQLIAAGNRGWLDGTVDWIEWPSLRVRRSLRAGFVGPVRPFGRGGPWTGEGMAIEGQDLYLLPEDGPGRLYHFRLDGPPPRPFG